MFAFVYQAGLLDRRRLSVAKASGLTLFAFILPVLIVTLLRQPEVVNSLAHAPAPLLDSLGSTRWTPRDIGIHHLHRRQSSSANDDDEDSSSSSSSTSKTKSKGKIVKKRGCKWPQAISNAATGTTALKLVIGLTIGSIVGMIIAAFAAYQYGATHRANAAMGGMGGMPMGGGMY